MFRAWLKVARPLDWSGSLAKAGAMLATLLLLVIPILARVPETWVTVAFGQVWIMRIVLVVASLWMLMQLRAVVYAALPGSVVLLGRRIRVPGRLRGRWLRTAEVAKVHVDLRPEGEVFVLELRDGSEVDMCPVACEGAPRLYARLVGRVGKKPPPANKTAPAKPQA